VHAIQPFEIALGDMGVEADAGLPPNTEGAVQVVALARHKVDGKVVHAGQHYWLEESRALAGAERAIVHVFGTQVVDWWDAPGRVLSPFDDRETVHTRAPSPGALRILQGCGYDPGSSAYRFHSAVNQESKHASAFVRFGDENPHCSLRQYDGIADAPIVRQALEQADVLHCHMFYYFRPSPDQWVVRHYHGTRRDGVTTIEHRVDDDMRARGKGLIRVGARLTICAEPDAGDVEWLPIAVPVKRYRALVKRRKVA
jgi:hypothetical protein